MPVRAFYPGPLVAGLICICRSHLRLWPQVIRCWFDLGLFLVFGILVLPAWLRGRFLVGLSRRGQQDRSYAPFVPALIVPIAYAHSLPHGGGFFSLPLAMLRVGRPRHVWGGRRVRM